MGGKAAAGVVFARPAWFLKHNRAWWHRPPSVSRTGGGDRPGLIPAAQIAHSRKKKGESIHQCWLVAGVRLKNLMSRRSRDASRIERWDFGDNLRWPRLWVVTATCEEATTTSSEKWKAGLRFLCCSNRSDWNARVSDASRAVRIFTAVLTQSLFVLAK